MKRRAFTDLTDDEVREIVTDLFEPKKITCIKRRKRDEEITCRIYTEWGNDDDDDGVFLARDDLTLKNPFLYGARSVSVDFSTDWSDVEKLRKFCWAKGVTAGMPDYSKENPYAEEKATVVLLAGKADSDFDRKERSIEKGGKAVVRATFREDSDEADYSVRMSLHRRKADMSDVLIVISDGSLSKEAKDLVSYAERIGIKTEIVGKENSSC